MSWLLFLLAIISVLLTYTVYRLRSDGKEEKVAVISGIDGPAAVPLVNATDRIEDYVIEWDMAKPEPTLKTRSR